jgi:hypothetical protein
MAHVFCHQCGHKNPDDATFCSSCGALLGPLEDHTLTLSRVDPLQASTTAENEVVVDLGSLPGHGSLILRNGPQAGEAFALNAGVTKLGRHPDSDISLDDITVSRRHAEVEGTDAGFVVRDAGSLNGTYLNHERIDSSPLRQGDELQVGKFRLVFFERGAS